MAFATDGGHSSSPEVTRGVQQPTRGPRPGRPQTPPYSVLLRVGFSLPAMSPRRRCALTAPFHPCHPPGFPGEFGGVFSVALSLGSPPLAVNQHAALWSPDFPPRLVRRRGDRPARSANTTRVSPRSRSPGEHPAPGARGEHPAGNILDEREARDGCSLQRIAFLRGIRRGSWRAGVPLRMHGQRFSVVLLDGPLADRTASQSPGLRGMRSEQLAARVASGPAAHVKWSDGSCVKVARPVASSLTSAASCPGSLSLQPCDRSFETQHAELQYTLLRPACSRA